MKLKCPSCESVLLSCAVVGPSVEIITQSEPPMVGEMYNAKCVGTAPADVQGTVTATWVDQSGTVLSGNSSMDMACVTLTIDPFLPDSVGVYRCQVSCILYDRDYSYLSLECMANFKNTLCPQMFAISVIAKYGIKQIYCDSRL